MSLITKKTAALIWNAYAEIEKGEALLVEMKNTPGLHDEPAPTPRDVFGNRHRDYQFGIPTGPGSHQLLGVTPRLAVYVVEAHVADMKAELEKACIAARMELDRLGKESGASAEK